MLSRIQGNLKKFHIYKYLYIIIIPTFLLIFNGFMIIFPQEIILGAQKGLKLWFNNVIPSLLPFIICANMLVNLGFPEIMGIVLGKFTNKAFRLRGICAFPVMAGVISGYPIGIKTTVDIYKQGLISKSEAERLFTFANNSGPLFILGTVGVGMLHSAGLGYVLMLVHYLATFIIMAVTGIFFKKAKIVRNDTEIIKRKNKERLSFGKILGESVSSAMSTILLIGGYIILFSVINSMLLKTGIIIPLARFFNFFGFNGSESVGIAISLFEITNGCNILSELGSEMAFILCGAAISWGGLSIHAQTISIISETDLSSRPYFIGKIAHCILSFVIGITVVRVLC